MSTYLNDIEHLVFLNDKDRLKTIHKTITEHLQDINFINKLPSQKEIENFVDFYKKELDIQP